MLLNNLVRRLRIIKCMLFISERAVIITCQFSSITTLGTGVFCCKSLQMDEKNTEVGNNVFLYWEDQEKRVIFSLLREDEVLGSQRSQEANL